MTPVLELRRLDFSYHDGKKALQDVSFSVGEGERVALIGPNGAGKSTLLAHLNGLLPDEFGSDPSVFIFGRPVCAETLEQTHRQVGFLFQDPDDQLFCPTVFEDVAFGPRQFGADEAAIARIVRQSLEHVGLPGSEDRIPHHLSAGEKQRVCLAGVLACQPRVLALDEPTSDLDPRGKRGLMDLLAKLPVTQIMASHDLELVARLCPRAILLDSGRLIADGPTLQLLADEKLMLEHGLEKPHSLQHLHPHGGRSLC
ncbi:MAG TPA: cobalt ABC transporter ATP-binding protein [Elusimicrobia bacterium]|nr:cobalt ABC transporter ATP-binding protein [Elusimicrobiota bacterium]HBT60167.1 cobalt ABC transporter ATP-binding protein [Elusimicrobiota bacterium]